MAGFSRILTPLFRRRAFLADFFYIPWRSGRNSPQIYLRIQLFRPSQSATNFVTLTVTFSVFLTPFLPRLS